MAGVPAMMVDTWGEETAMSEIHGTSMTVLITTSSLTVHTAVDLNNKEKGIIYLDLFSCKDFQYSDVIKSVNKYWSNPEILRWQLLDR